jgi:hypothetical protein
MGSSRKCALAVALAMLAFSEAAAQSPSLDALNVLPPSPTTSDNVQAQVGGVHNVSGAPIIRTEWRRLGSDIRLDVLIDELPVLAPALMLPYSRQQDFGALPAGVYTLTARLFWDYRFGTLSSFPDPWLFPDAYGQPLTPGSNGTLTSAFAVVPEPSVAIMALAATSFALASRRARLSLRPSPAAIVRT